MSFSRQFTYIVLTAAAAVASLLIAPAAGAAEQAGGLPEYWKAVEADDPGQALKIAEGILAAMRAENPDSAALKSVEARLKAVASAEGELAYKMAVITKGIGGKASAFAYVSPTPAELAVKISQKVGAARPHFQGLSQDQAAFAKSAVETALQAADREALDSYDKLLAAGPEGEAAAKARAYLSAYVMGAHDNASLPGALRKVADAASGGALPVFLLEDALTELADFSAATRVTEALDAVEWAGWGEGERMRLLRLMAEKALKADEYDWAVTAHRKIVEAADEETAEEVQYEMIEIHMEHAKKMKKPYMPSDEREALTAVYKSAAQDCGGYLDRFAAGKRRLTVAYLKAVYEFLSGNHEQAVKDATAFRAGYPESRHVAGIMLVEAIATSSMGDTDKALALFGEIMEKYPKENVAGRAAFLAGNCHLATQRYAEAREMFQKVVDFYPNDPSAQKAKDLLEKLPKEEQPGR